MGLSIEHSRALGLLETKAKTMHILDDLNLGNMPRFAPSTVALQGLVGLHVRSVQVRNQSNLEQGLAQAANDHKELIYTLRHRADADTPIFRKGLKAIGKESEANNTVWVAGTNMLIRPQILPFSFSEEVIYIATPEDTDRIKNLAEIVRDPAEAARIRWVEEVFNKMNASAKVKARDHLRNGKHLVLYPEAGRSKDGFLRRAPKIVSVYFPRDDRAIIIPVVMNGTEEINKPGEDITLNRIKPENRKDIEIVFGEPYLSGRLWLPYKNGNKDIFASDVAMAYIALTEPTQVREEDMDYYRKIQEKVMKIEARP